LEGGRGMPGREARCIERSWRYIGENTNRDIILSGNLVFALVLDLM